MGKGGAPAVVIIALFLIVLGLGMTLIPIGVFLFASHRPTLGNLLGSFLIGVGSCAAGIFFLVWLRRRAAWLEGTTLVSVGAFWERRADLAAVDRAAVRTYELRAGTFRTLRLRGGGNLHRFRVRNPSEQMIPLSADDLDRIADALGHHPTPAVVAPAIAALRQLSRAGRSASTS